MPRVGRRALDYGPPVQDDQLFRIIDVMDGIAEETGKSVPQIAINWLLQRPTVSSVIIGARNSEQLRGRGSGRTGRADAPTATLPRGV